MKTYEEAKYRFESLVSILPTKQIGLRKFCLEPPATENELCQHEKKWNKRLPDEMRRFFLNVSRKIIFEWGTLANDKNPDIKKDLPHKFDSFVCRWPGACGFDWSLEQMDWFYELYWPRCEEAFNDAEYYSPLSPYDYSFSYPFIYGDGGELFILYAPPSGKRLIFHYGDSVLNPWHKVANSFDEFWESWSLIGCPHFGSYEGFYNNRKKIIDIHCEDAMTWRRFMGIEHLEATPSCIK